MDHVATRLDRAAEALLTLDSRLPAPAAPPRPAPAGVPGRLAHDLRVHWAAVLAARSREATTLATRLTDLAAAVRSTQRQYTETDETAARRLSRGLP